MTSEDIKHQLIICVVVLEAQELCESRGGRPGFLKVSVGVKQH